MQGTRKGIYKRRNKIVKTLYIKTVRYHFFSFYISKKFTEKKQKQPSRKMGRRPKQTFLQRRHTGGHRHMKRC